jgi:hypothetical protein
MWYEPYLSRLWQDVLLGKAVVLNHWNGLALSVSVALSVVALFISYRAMRQNTVPVISVRESSTGGIEIVNTGSITAIDIELELVERTRRPSGRLVSKKSLSKDEAAIISAFDCLDDVHKEYPARDFEARIRRFRGEETRTAPNDLARHLLSRDGKQLLIVSYGVPDSPKRITRIFDPIMHADRSVRFRLKKKRSARAYSMIYRLRYSGFPVYAPPFDFSQLRSPHRDLTHAPSSELEPVISGSSQTDAPDI